jgi:ribosomal protein L11 methyltransferase
VTAHWWHVTVTCRPEDTDRVAAGIVMATGHGVEEPQVGVLTTVLGTEHDARRLVGTLAEHFTGLEASVVEREPVDWTVRWRDGIATRRFGRLVLTPSWLPVEVANHEVVVTLDPESAFGSGEHGSTRAALALLERHLRPRQRLIDFGSGSGILAIAAAKLGADSAVGIEVDDEAIPIAEANAVRNAVADRVTFLLGDAGHLHALVGPADLVCSNILRTVNTQLLPAIRDALRPGGLAIFAGMEAAEAPSFLSVLAEADWTVRDQVRDGEWWAVAAVRPR